MYRPDSLIVGTRGKSANALQKMLTLGAATAIGHVSRDVLSRSPVPVVVVRPEAKVQKHLNKRRKDPNRRGYHDLVSKSAYEALPMNISKSKRQSMQIRSRSSSPDASARSAHYSHSNSHGHAHGHGHGHAPTKSVASTVSATGIPAATSGGGITPSTSASALGPDGLPTSFSASIDAKKEQQQQEAKSRNHAHDASTGPTDEEEAEEEEAEDGAVMMHSRRPAARRAAPTSTMLRVDEGGACFLPDGTQLSEQQNGGIEPLRATR